MRARVKKRAAKVWGSEEGWRKDKGRGTGFV